MSRSADILEDFNEASKGKLVDDVYAALNKIMEFKQLSMDAQGEISVKVAKLITGGR